ncbi:hypothetical protein ACE7GA_25690 [Roseomonas sp. CCTCC AB2023176]|uniref:hypothetical protein n=1 Tax=Roseomonas sp. CCTCC AB2023176 TaxID=3342640 RepID=UPI0035DA300C
MARDRADAMAKGGRLGALVLLAGLAGCADADFAPFGRSGSAAPPDSLTVRRVLGEDVEPPPLLPEAGNVWPAAEAPARRLRIPTA